MKTRDSLRYFVNDCRSSYGHKFSKYKKCLSVMMHMYLLLIILFTNKLYAHIDIFNNISKKWLVVIQIIQDKKQLKSLKKRFALNDFSSYVTSNCRSFHMSV